MIPTYTRAMDLSDETEEKPRRPEMDAWTRVRLGDYADSILSSAVDRDVLMDHLALALPHFLAELRRVTDPELEQIPVPFAAGQAVAGVASASDDDGAPHPGPLSVATGSRVETLEALAKMIDAAPKAWPARRALIAGPIADGVQALQEAGTSPDVLVRDVLSMLRPAAQDYTGLRAHADFYNLVPYLRRILGTVPEELRGDTWDRALFALVDVLDDALVLVPEQAAGNLGRRSVGYCHELLCRAASGLLPTDLLARVAEYFERAIRFGFLEHSTGALRRFLLSIEAKCAVEQAEPGRYERLTTLNLLSSQREGAMVAQSIHSLALGAARMSLDKASIALIRVARIALLLDTQGEARCIMHLNALRSAAAERGDHALLCAFLSAVAAEISVRRSKFPWRSLERLFLDMNAVPPDVSARLAAIITPLAAKSFAAYPQLSERARGHFRKLRVGVDNVSPDTDISELLANLTDNLAYDVAGVQLYGTRAEWRIFALRSILEQIYPNRRDTATTVVLELIGQLIDLPDDPRALVVELYGPYLEDGLAAGEEILPRDEWRQLVAEASGADLPADLAEGLRVCFSGKAGG